MLPVEDGSVLKEGGRESVPDDLDPRPDESLWLLTGVRLGALSGD